MNKNENSPFDFEQLGSVDQPDDNDLFSLENSSEFIPSGDFGFDIDPPDTDELVQPDEQVADQYTSSRVMECICPKCTEITEVNLALMPDKGFVVACSSCSKQMYVIRESSARRARRKSHEINCVNCGKVLDQHAHCYSCGTQFPDFFVTFNPEDARRKSRSDFFSQKLAAIKNLNFSLKPNLAKSSHGSTLAYSPVRHSTKTLSTKSSATTRRYLVFAVSIIAAIAIVAGGIFAYNSSKSEQMYAENYFKTLYCLKVGIDSNIAVSTSVKTEWESALKAGTKFTPGISSKAETDAANLRSTIDKYMQKTGEPAKKFAQIHNSLLTIHNIYMESESLLQSRPNSLQGLTTSVDSISKKMRAATAEFKSNIPESFKKELETTKLKYRDMKDF
jgi:hypothetical protein